jgi:hypothetical protein
MIHHHAVIRAVAQARIQGFLVQAAADGRAGTVRRLRRKRVVPVPPPPPIAEPGAPAHTAASRSR